MKKDTILKTTSFDKLTETYLTLDLSSSRI